MMITKLRGKFVWCKNHILENNGPYTNPKHELECKLISLEKLGCCYLQGYGIGGCIASHVGRCYLSPCDMLLCTLNKLVLCDFDELMFCRK